MCIDDDFSDRVENPTVIKRLNLPEEGKIYTIRETIQIAGNEDAVLLEEIHNVPFQSGATEKEPLFALSHFCLYTPPE